MPSAFATTPTSTSPAWSRPSARSAAVSRPRSALPNVTCGSVRPASSRGGRTKPFRRECSRMTPSSVTVALSRGRRGHRSSSDIASNDSIGLFPSAPHDSTAISRTGSRDRRLPEAAVCERAMAARHAETSAWSIRRTLVVSISRSSWRLRPLGRPAGIALAGVGQDGLALGATQMQSTCG